jgi:uncharacterized Zn finger protein
MIKGRKCPACGSADTELLITIGDRQEYDCLRCSNIWARTVSHSELRHVDPLEQWGATGEEV